MNTVITQYKTAYGMLVTDVDEMVNKLIGEGWQPYGNGYYSGAYMYQPMIKTVDLD